MIYASSSRRSAAGRCLRPLTVWTAVLALLAGATAPPALHAQARAVEQEGPSPEQVSSAIAGGLEWLHRNQVKVGENQGYWDSPGYHTATASFAGLAFLANGHRPGKGRYGETIVRAMNYVKASMTPEGYLGGKEDTMYAHAICTLFGLAYLGRSENPEEEVELANWCRKAIQLILRAQKVPKSADARGGWRYKYYSRESDLSVTSWQLLVLHAARQCGYDVPEEAFQNAMRYVNGAYLDEEAVERARQKTLDKEEMTPEERKAAEARLAAKQGRAGFVYRRGVSREVEPAVTGVAVFLKSILEEEPDEKTRKSLAFLETFSPAWGGKQYKGYFFFGTFYMVQGMFQVGGENWKAFRPRIQEILLDHQEGDGRWLAPEDNVPQSLDAGVAYSTAMGVLILSVEKQYLPMYQRVQRIY